MAELDKNSESCADNAEDSTTDNINVGDAPEVNLPKRQKKRSGSKMRRKTKCNTVKVELKQKNSDTCRLRSSR